MGDRSEGGTETYSTPLNFRWTLLRAQFAMLPTRSFTGVARCALSRSQVSVCLSVPQCLLIFSSGSSLCVSGTHCCFCWNKRKQRTHFYIPISIDEPGYDTLARVNIPSRSFREMVRQGTIMLWIVTAQLPSLLLGIGPEISESVKTIYDAAKVKPITQACSSLMVGLGSHPMGRSQRDASA